MSERVNSLIYSSTTCWWVILYFNCITLVKHIKSVGRIRLKINKSQKIICQIFSATGHLWPAGHLLATTLAKLGQIYKARPLNTNDAIIGNRGFWCPHWITKYSPTIKGQNDQLQQCRDWLQKAKLFFLFQSVHITGRRPQRTSGPKTNCTTKAYSRDTNDLNLQIKRRCVSLNVRIKTEKNESHCVFRLFSWSCWGFFFS